MRNPCRFRVSVGSIPFVGNVSGLLPHAPTRRLSSGAGQSAARRHQRVPRILHRHGQADHLRQLPCDSRATGPTRPMPTHTPSWPASGHRRACYTCHTVSEKGTPRPHPPAGTRFRTQPTMTCSARAAMDPAKITSPRGPDDRDHPLAGATAAGSRGRVDSAATAASCGLPHGRSSAVRRGVGAVGPRAPGAGGGRGSPGRHPNCASCHEGKATLAAWGVTANYAEKGRHRQRRPPGPMTCSVCHDPHGSARSQRHRSGQLRFPIDVPIANQNLCMKCHQRRSEPDATSRAGRTHLRAPMLLGDAGYQPAGFQPDLQAVATTTGPWQ